VLSFLKRKPEALAKREEKGAGQVRKKQQNIKVSEDCGIAFAALAEVQGVTKAALFEDMVAERPEALQRQGVKLGIE
jgi:hypothetical protein